MALVRRIDEFFTGSGRESAGDEAGGDEARAETRDLDRNKLDRNKLDLDKLDLDQSILAREGMSVDDLVRAKIHYLAAQDRSLVQQIQLSDAKAATVLTLIGVLAVNMAKTPAPGAPLVLTLAFWLLIAVCMGAAIWAVIPRYPKTEARTAISARDRYSWPGLCGDAFGGDDYALFMRDSQPTQLILSMARSNSAVSGILLKKFRALRLSFLCAGGAVAMLGLRTALGY